MSIRQSELKEASAQALVSTINAIDGKSVVSVDIERDKLTVSIADPNTVEHETRHYYWISKRWRRHD